MKKNQKIKKVRMLPRGKASLQRGLSFFYGLFFSTITSLIFSVGTDCMSYAHCPRERAKRLWRRYWRHLSAARDPDLSGARPDLISSLFIPLALNFLIFTKFVSPLEKPRKRP